MFTTQYDQFHKRQELIVIGVGIAVIVLSVVLQVPRVVRILLLALGAWIVVSRNLAASMRASDSVDHRGGQLPEYQYSFYDDHLRLQGEGSSLNIPYAQLIRLVEDRDYFYLFNGEESVMMLDQQALSPATPDEFREFLSKRTGRSFRKSRNLLMMTLQDLLGH